MTKIKKLDKGDRKFGPFKKAKFGRPKKIATKD